MQLPEVVIAKESKLKINFGDVWQSWQFWQ